MKQPWSKTDPNNNSDVKSYEHCNACGREWYAAENKVGFLTCPFCKQYSSISTRLDTTTGAQWDYKYSTEQNIQLDQQIQR